MAKSIINGIVYNVEDFIIQEMFRPYQNLIVNQDYLELGTNGLDELEKQDVINRKIKKIERDIRKDATPFLCELEMHSKVYKYVYERLAKLDFKFYKWLDCPYIKTIMRGYWDAKIALDEEIKNEKHNARG